jgi:hypothetical protein
MTLGTDPHQPRRSVKAERIRSTIDVTKWPGGGLPQITNSERAKHGSFVKLKLQVLNHWHTSMFMGHPTVLVIIVTVMFAKCHLVEVIIKQ